MIMDRIQCTLSIESNRHVAIDFPSSSPSNKISKVCSLQKKQNHPLHKCFLARNAVTTFQLLTSL